MRQGHLATTNYLNNPPPAGALPEVVRLQHRSDPAASGGAAANDAPSSK